jgi:hypothetical protein
MLDIDADRYGGEPGDNPAATVGETGLPGRRQRRVVWRTSASGRPSAYRAVVTVVGG